MSNKVPTHTVGPKPNQPAKNWLPLVKLFGSWIAAVLIVILLANYAFRGYQVFGQSMEPALKQGDYLIISKLSVSWSKLFHKDYLPNRGDIVVLDSTVNHTQLIKRVIGLPGERVTVAGGEVTIYNDEHPNGFDPYQELGLDTRFADGQLTMVVPEHHVFVIGDNRIAGGSLDSRSELGPVPTKNIVGHSVLRLYPFGDLKKF